MKDGPLSGTPPRRTCRTGGERVMNGHAVVVSSRFVSSSWGLCWLGLICSGVKRQVQHAPTVVVLYFDEKLKWCIICNRSMTIYPDCLRNTK